MEIMAWLAWLAAIWDGLPALFLVIGWLFFMALIVWWSER